MYLLLFVMCLGPGPYLEDGCGNCPGAQKLSGNIPACLPGETSIGDCLLPTGWHTFIALNWPPVHGKRGVPYKPDDASVFEKNRLVSVWETWKQEWELSLAQPTPWDSYEAEKPICDCIVINGQEIKVTPDNWAGLFEQYGSTVVTMYEQPTLEKDPTNPALSTTQLFSYRPLIDQNRQFIGYNVRYNQVAYDYVRNRKLGKITGPFSFPAAVGGTQGSIVAKGAYFIKPQSDGEPIFEGILVLSKEAGKNKCYVRDTELIGVHVSQKFKQLNCDPSKDPNCDVEKTSTGKLRNKWLWTTFLREDLVPSWKYPFYETGLTSGFSRVPEPTNVVTPFCDQVPNYDCQYVKVASIRDVNPSIQQENIDWIELIEDWKDFHMVAAQWFSAENRSEPTGNFAVANPVIDTYSQDKSCNDCHQASKTDFIFGPTPADTAYFQAKWR